MARSSYTFSADTSLHQIGYLGKEGVIHTVGSFGGGTLTLFVSFDNGTTKEALIDTAAAYSKTVADMFTFNMPIVDDAGKGALLYGTLAGSTAPSLKVEILDVRSVA